MWPFTGKKSSPVPAERPQPQQTQRTPPRTNLNAVAPKPLELIKYDEATGKFEVGEEAASVLASVDTPIAVLAVCGRARQGKSYILNQLLQRLTHSSQGALGNGFKVDSTHRPCTKGLWMWSRPVPMKDRRGRAIHVVLLDTEGIDSWDQTGQYSTQIFSLAILLSSLFVYNQMGGIDEKALDGLSLVTEMTKHIKVKASQQGGVTEREIGEFSPHFVWLLRDFYLHLSEGGRRITPTEYLEEALRPLDQTGPAAESKNKIRASIKAVFPDRQCFTLVRPINEEHKIQQLDALPSTELRPEFTQGMQDLLNLLMDRAAPKKVGDFELRGPMLARLAEAYVQALNGGAVPVIQTAWQGVADSTCREAADAALELYRQSFNEGVGADDAALDREHDRAKDMALALFRDKAVGDHEILAVHEKKLVAAIDAIFGQTKKMAQTQAENRCREALMNAQRHLTAVLQSRDLGRYNDEVQRVLAQYDAQMDGPAKGRLLSEFMRDHVLRPAMELQESELRQQTEKAQRAHGEAEELRRRIAALEAEVEALKAADVKARAANLSLQQNLEGAQREVAEARARSTADQGKFSEERAALEREVADLRGQLAAKTARITQMEGAVADLERETRQRVGELEAQLKRKSDRVVAVEAEVVDKRRELDARQKELDEARERAREEERKAREVRAAHDAEVNKRREAEERARRAEVAAEGARGEGQRELQEATRKVGELERSLREATALGERLAAEKEQLRSDRAKLQQEGERLRAELQERIEQLQREAEANRAELEQLRRALQERQENAAAGAGGGSAVKRRRVAEEEAGGGGDRTPPRAPGGAGRPGGTPGRPMPKTIPKIREELNEFGYDEDVNLGVAQKWKRAEWEECWTKRFGNLNLSSMPTLNVTTNVKCANHSKFLKAASAAVSKATGKPERWVLVSLKDSVPMMYAGTEEPAAYAELISIGAVGGEKNKQISEIVMGVFKAELGVNPDRIYMHITDAERSNFCYDSSTF